VREQRLHRVTELGIVPTCGRNECRSLVRRTVERGVADFFNTLTPR
jgi:hypothetical protein